MKRIEALKELERKVVSEGDDTHVWVKVWPVGGGPLTKALKAYNGSLDAAKALHEAVLHERVKVVLGFTGRYGCQVSISDMGSYLSEASSEEGPARAWLLAILRALIAIEEKTQ